MLGKNPKIGMVVEVNTSKGKKSVTITKVSEGLGCFTLEGVDEDGVLNVFDEFQVERLLDY